GGAEEDGEKRGNKLAEPAESAEGKDVSELCSDGKLKHAPPMRRSRLKMAKRQVRAALGWTGAKNDPRGMVGRTPWSAADAPVGPLALCMMLISLARQRDEGVPRGPGGPPHHLRSQRGHSVFHGISRAEGPFKQGRQTNPGSRSRKPETDGTASEFPAKGAGNPWQSRQSPEGTVVGGQFFMKFRGPKAHPNRPGGLSYGLWPFSSGEFVPVAAPGSVGGRRLPLAVRRGESGSPSQGVALSPTLLAKMCFPAW